METDAPTNAAVPPEGGNTSAQSANLSVVPAKGAFDSTVELKAFNAIVSALQSVPEDVRPRLIRSVFTFLGYSDVVATPHASAEAPVPAQHRTSTKPSGFSEDRSLSPKEFLFQKKPVTDIERMACLAYYLAHYRGTAHFKTLDLSTLNTEAAQIKFANAAGAVENATTAGLLVQAGKGAKQLSAAGELYVQNLPDRDAAKAAIAHIRPRRKNRKSAEDAEDEK